MLGIRGGGGGAGRAAITGAAAAIGGSPVFCAMDGCGLYEGVAVCCGGTYIGGGLEGATEPGAANHSGTLGTSVSPEGGGVDVAAGIAAITAGSSGIAGGATSA